MRRTISEWPIRSYIGTLFATLLLSGCASIPDKIQLSEVSARPLSFDVLDKRPAESLGFRRISLGIREEFYLGDQSFSPSRIAVITDRLQERAGEALKGKRLQLEELEVRVAHNRTGVDSGGGPPWLPGGNVAANVVGNLLGALTLGSLNSGGEILVSCSIKGKVDGRPFEVSEYTDAGPRNVEVAIRRAVHNAADMLVGEVTKLLNSSAVRIESAK
jgi:hypothetical protein